MSTKVKVRTTDVTAAIVEGSVQPGIHDLYSRTRLATVKLKTTTPIVPAPDDYIRMTQTNGVVSAFEGLVKIPDSSQIPGLRTGVEYTVAAQGWEGLLDTIVITASYTVATNTVDVELLAKMLSLYYGPISTTAIHKLYPARTDLNAMIISAGQWTLRSFIDWLAAEAGGVTWWIDVADKSLHYNDNDGVAPFILSDAPDSRSTYLNEVLADAPVGYWRLGEAVGSTIAKDSSGNGLDGTYTGSPTLGSFSLVDDDLSATFKASAYVDLGLPTKLLPTGSFSVEGWLYINPVTYPDISTNWSIFNQEAYQASGCMFRVEGTAGQILARLNNGGISLSFTMAGAPANNYWYTTITGAPAYSIVSGDVIEYDVWWDQALARIGVDLNGQGVGGWNLRDSGAVDQNGLSAHPNIGGVGTYALNAWYTRRIPLTALIGRSGSEWNLVCEQDTDGTYTGKIRNLRITNNGVVKVAVTLNPLPATPLAFNGSASDTFTPTVFNSAQSLVSNASVVKATRTHVVMTYDDTAGRMTIFINGAQDNTAIGFTKPAIPTFSWISSLTQSFIGPLDEVAVYPVALSAARIAVHYAARVKSNQAYQSLLRSLASDGRRIRVTTDDGGGVNSYTATDWEKWQELNAKRNDEPGTPGVRIPESIRIVDTSLNTSEALKRRAWSLLTGSADRRSFDVVALTEGLQIGQSVDIRSGQYGTLDGAGNPVAPHPFLDQFELMAGSPTEDLDTAMGRYLVTKVTPVSLGRDKWVWQAQVGDRDQVAAALSTRGGNTLNRLSIPDAAVTSRMLDPVTVRTGKVTVYGPFQWVSPPANQSPPPVDLLLPDGSFRITVPNKCWISRVYMTLTKDITAPTTFISFQMFRNADPAAFGSPNIAFLWKGLYGSNFSMQIFNTFLANAGADQSNLHWANFPGLAPAIDPNNSSNTNILAAGDAVAMGGTTNNFTPNGAGQTLSVSFETTDY